MPVRITIHDSTEPTTVGNRNQLKAALAAASDEARAKNMLSAVILEAENGNSITMVLGGEETVLGFKYGHLDPPYYASKGRSDEDEPLLTCFLTLATCRPASIGKKSKQKNRVLSVIAMLQHLTL